MIPYRMREYILLKKIAAAIDADPSSKYAAATWFFSRFLLESAPIKMMSAMNKADTISPISFTYPNYNQLLAKQHVLIQAVSAITAKELLVSI